MPPGYHVATWIHPPTIYPTFSALPLTLGIPLGSCTVSQLTLGRGVISKGVDRRPSPNL